MLERIWRRLLDRAGDPPAAHWTEDPDLHLVANGSRVAVSQIKGGVHVFTIPVPTETLHIVSRSAIPAAAGLNSDQRRLGVAVRKIVLRASGVRISICYDAELLRDGFHSPEIKNGWRWTTGHAAVPASLLTAAVSPLTVEVHVGCTLRYPIETLVPGMRTAA